VIRTATILLTLVLLPASLRAQDGVVYVPGAKAAPILERGGRLAAAPGVLVESVKRTSAGQVEVHGLDTDTFYILEGEATFVAGGTAVGLKRTSANEQRGTNITGGRTYELRKGDVVVIPPGTPHWFKRVPREIVYYTVKARNR
jgi:quercetin dioxygenase-like cupin family protein